ncbi:hypothetical protein [Paraburkholderia bengalensis]|uniref:hypothetical protein n=1 Tax=Paraburkholderia bengalensis TaxID=2747562 RepID=UPI003AF9A857
MEVHGDDAAEHLATADSAKYDQKSIAVTNSPFSANYIEIHASLQLFMANVGAIKKTNS